MQLVDPLYKDHWRVVLLTVLEHGAHLANEAIEIEDHVSVVINTNDVSLLVDTKDHHLLSR